MGVPRCFWAVPSPDLARPPSPLTQFERVKRLEDGSVALYFHEAAVVTARPDGSLVLDSAGHQHSKATQKSIAGALALFGLTLRSLPDTSPAAAATSDGKRNAFVWQVSDGKHLLRRFADGMVLPPAPGSKSRAQLLLDSYTHASDNDARAGAGGMDTE